MLAHHKSAFQNHFHIAYKSFSIFPTQQITQFKNVRETVNQSNIFVLYYNYMKHSISFFFSTLLFHIFFLFSPAEVTDLLEKCFTYALCTQSFFRLCCNTTNIVYILVQLRELYKVTEISIHSFARRVFATRGKQMEYSSVIINRNE